MASGLTDQEVQARIDAGQVLYQAQNCGGCHGSDGTGASLGGSIVVGVVSAAGSLGGCSDTHCSSYDAMVSVIGNGIANTLMPACTATSSDPECATKIADYVWAELNKANGYTLTADGGTK